MALPGRSGLNWIAGGGAASALLPALALGAGFPFWAALGISVLAGAGVVVLLTPARPFEKLEAGGMARGKIDFALSLLNDAAPLVARISAASRLIKDGATGARTKHLGDTASGIMSAIEKDPLKIDRVRRFITYYLPRAAEMAEAHGALERAPSPDAARLRTLGDLINRLDQAFTRYANSLTDADLDKLDIELKLLKGSLDEDMGPAAAPVPSDQPAKRSA